MSTFRRRLLTLGLVLISLTGLLGYSRVVAISQGGTGATTAAGARTALDVQQLDADLTTWGGLTPSAFFQTLTDDADASTIRASIGTQGIATDQTTLTCSHVTVVYTGNASVTLPAASGCGAGQPIRLYASANATLTLTRAGSDEIDDTTSITVALAAGDSRTIVRESSTDWRSLQGGGWRLVYSQSFASVDVSGASFTLGGVVWTFANKASGTITSDATGLTIQGDVNGTAVTASAPLSSISANYDSEQILACVQRDAVAPACPTPSTSYKDQFWGFGDEDGNPGGFIDTACNSTAPSGYSVQTTRGSSGLVKESPAIDVSTVHWLCVRVADGMGFTTLYGTSATLDPLNLTEAEAAFAESVSPGAASLSEHLRLGVVRGASTHSALFKAVRVYRWGR